MPKMANPEKIVLGLPLVLRSNNRRLFISYNNRSLFLEFSIVSVYLLKG